MLIAVAGATGVVGRHVVENAGARGHQVVELARSRGVDLTGDARQAQLLAARLGRVDAVVDVTSVRTQSRSRAEGFFTGVTRTLLGAEQAAGVGHHIALSIVGVDDVASGYYQGKQAQERLVQAAPVGWSILRATQFHEFAEQVLGFVRLGRVSVVPQMLSQPVAAVEVAQALVDLAEAGPSGRVPDLAGPERLQMVDLARRVSQARSLGRGVVGVPVPGAGGRAMRSGALCPTGEGPRGTTTFEQWLAGA